MAVTGNALLLNLILVVSVVVDTDGKQENTGLRCDGNTIKRTITSDLMTIHSPGYPGNYQSNDECIWEFDAPFGKSLMIQFTAVDIDLNDYKGDCNSDYIEFVEEFKIVAKWCGNQTKVIKLSGKTLQLRFVSDDLFNGKGFAIRYSYIKPVNAECKEKADTDTPILITDKAPLYEAFRASPHLTRCEWRIESDDDDLRLVIELVKPSNVKCKDGVYNFYEDDPSDSHVNFQYCSSLTPFSTMYLEKNHFTLTFERTAEHMKDVPDDLILMIYTRPAKDECSKKEPFNLEVPEAPVFFSLPHSLSSSDCPVVLKASDSAHSIRLDVMGTDDQEVTCNSDLLLAKDSNTNKMVSKECSMATTTPVYRYLDSAGLHVEAKSNSITFLRASSIHKECAGFLDKKVAYSDIILKQTIPSEGSYSNLAYCRYLITSAARDMKVRLTVHWDPPKEDNLLPPSDGDSITIYDGDVETASVLSKLTNNQGEQTITVTSSNNDILVILEADSKLFGKSAHISYYAVSGHCEKIMETKVSNDVKMVTSPNYPNQLSPQETCIHHLVSQNVHEEMVIEVIDADLPNFCESSLTVIEGKDDVDGSSNVLGRICGKDKPIFHSSDKFITLITKSGTIKGHKGWKMKVYTQTKSSSPAAARSGNQCSHAITVGFSFDIILVTFLAATVLKKI